MERGEFEKTYLAIVEQALKWNEFSRRNGLLDMEDMLDETKVDERDIFHLGMRFVVDGTDEAFIDKVLSNIIAQEMDGDKKLLKIVQKEAVLGIQSGMPTHLIALLLGSYVDNKLANAVEKILNNAVENILNNAAREESDE